MNIQNKKVLVIGSAASGIAAAKLAHAKKAIVSIYDQKIWEQYNAEQRNSLTELEERGITLLLGVDIEQCITEYELVIMSPGVPMDLPFVIRAKQNSIAVIGELELASTYCNAPIVAITGTNGKTTTTALVGKIIKAHIPHTYVVGNIGRAFSEDVLSVDQDDVVVAEVSSFQLESISTFHPVVSTILNITPDHLNRHYTMENYIEMKKRIFENQTKEDYTILNYDDRDCRLIGRELKTKVIWFSRMEKVVPGVYIEGESIIENISYEPHAICYLDELKILGEHNVENALAAVAITSAIGVPTVVIRNELVSFEGVAHRIEYVGTKKGIDFYNDSKATNTDAAIKGLLAMKKKVRLIVGGLDKETDFTDWVQLFHGRVSGAYVIGETKKQLAETMTKIQFNNYQTFEGFDEAVYAAYEDAQQGECVLLSPGCASWDMFKSYEERGELFKKIFQSLKE